MNLADMICIVRCNFRYFVEKISLGETISVALARYRAIKEKYFPPDPEILTKCDEKSCMKAARITMIDPKLDFRVMVCFDHYKELRPQRDWELE